MDKKRVGMIGLGLMGTAMTERLLEAGYAVWVHNRTRNKAGPLIDRGARWSDNPLSECARVVISLYTTDTVEDVLGPLGKALRPGQILIDTTTGEPEQTAELGARLEKQGVHYLDAPISGSSQQTREGNVTTIVGGPREVFDACRDLFDCWSAKTIYAGPCGSGSKIKLVSNLVLGLNRAALAVVARSNCSLCAIGWLSSELNCRAQNRFVMFAARLVDFVRNRRRNTL